MKKVLVSLFAAILISTACGQTEEKKELKFKEGEHYEIVNETRSEDQIVTEYFSHFCGHCFQFENFVDTVKAQINAEFIKSHVSYIPQDDSLLAMGMVKAYIMMQDLDMEETISPQVFAAIHMSEDRLDSEDDIKNIFIINDVSSEQYDELFISESVNERATDMSEVWLERRITTVPTLVVNDKYKINMGSVQSLDELIELTNELLSLEQ